MPRHHRLVNPLNVGLPTDSELEASGYEIITKKDDDKQMDADSNENGTSDENRTRGPPQSTSGQVGASSPNTQDSSLGQVQGYNGTAMASTSNHGAPSAPSEQFFPQLQYTKKNN